MTESPESIAIKVESFAKFLRDEYLNPEWFDGFPGLPSPGNRPSLEQANFFLLGCLIDFRQWSWKAWKKADEFCNQIVPQEQRPRMWHWIASHGPDAWMAKKRRGNSPAGEALDAYDLHWKDDRHKAIRDIAEIIDTRYQGDPRTIWEQRDGEGVLKIVRDELKVGPKISLMVVGALRDHGLVRLTKSDFKADSHVCRMMKILDLSRTSRPDEVTAVAKRLFHDPWLVDNALWELDAECCVKTQDDFLKLYETMKTWLMLKSEVSSNLQKLAAQDLPTLLGQDGWEVDCSCTHHWVGVYLKRRNGPLAEEMSNIKGANVWAWAGVGFYCGLVFGVEVGCDHTYFRHSVKQSCNDMKLKEYSQTSSLRWGKRQWWRDSPVGSTENLWDVTWLRRNLLAGLRDGKRFVMTIESNL